MTKARTLADFNTTNINPANLDETGTIPSALLAGVGGGNTPAFDVRLTSSQSIPNDTYTKLTFGTELLDSDGTFTANRFTPAVAGNYLINYSIYYDVVDYIETMSLKLFKNGNGDNASERTNMAVATNSDLTVSGTYLIYLDADDYIELWTKQNSGSTATAYTGNTTFSGFKVT